MTPNPKEASLESKDELERKKLAAEIKLLKRRWRPEWVSILLTFVIAATVTYFSFRTNFVELVLQTGELAKEVDGLRQEKSSLEREKGALTVASQTLTAANETLRAENQTLRAENQTLRAENRTLRAENQRLRAENQKLTAENQKVREAQYVEKDLLVKKYNEAQETINTLTKRLGEIAAENQRLGDIERRYGPAKRAIDSLKGALERSLSELSEIYASQRTESEFVREEFAQGIERPDSAITIDGTIRDKESGKPISDVIVSITDRFGVGFSYQRTTDQRGRYSCRIPQNVNQGRILITINQSGYQPVEYNAWSGTDRTIDFALERE
jgi:DNA repair exonuclease SbcCD ATPase subunit